MAISKEAKDTWRAAPCAGPLTVTARVYAYDLSVRTAYLDATRGYFNGPSVFLCPDGRSGRACEVEIAPPAGAAFAAWRVATTLPSAGAAEFGFGAYRATDYDELIDHPVEMSDFAHVRFTAGGVPHDIAVSGRQRADLDRFARDLARVCQWQCDLFGGAAGAAAPFDRYLFQIAAVGDGYGGLEHRASTSLVCRRDELPQPGAAAIDDAYVNLLGLASHEYFHSWNVKRIKPAAFAPYDLARENYTRQLWVFEGFTSYYDDLALVRSGVIDAKRYLELLGRTITTVLRTPGRHAQSVAESSFDAWIKYYRQDENTPNAVVSYYTKGALVALALDLQLRPRGASLDQLMRTLWERTAAPATACRRARSRRSPASSAGPGSRISSPAACMAPRIRRSRRCWPSSASRSICGRPKEAPTAAARRARRRMGQPARGRRARRRACVRGSAASSPPATSPSSSTSSPAVRCSRPACRPTTPSSPSTGCARRPTRSTGWSSAGRPAIRSRCTRSAATSFSRRG